MGSCETYTGEIVGCDENGRYKMRWKRRERFDDMRLNERKEKRKNDKTI